LAQSWAAISGSGDPDRVRKAMESANRELVLPNESMVLLFAPPFDHAKPHPGYIMGYPPGIRENGGQYTHGSLWLAMAWARMSRTTGDGTRAVSLLRMMNPIEHSRDPQTAAKYAGEPYVAAADVYSAPGRVGRSGWTWYTGSAGWMYRIWIEEVLGLQVRGQTLSLRPVIPSEWQGFELVYRYRSATYEITVKRVSSGGGGVELDGRPSETTWIPLIDDNAIHRVTVNLAPPAPALLEPDRKPQRMLV
jgi:cyclic beta-1,2-glucan synthetase